MSWQTICAALKEDENSLLIQALKNIVHDAEDLALIDIEDLKRIADRGFLLKKTKPLLYKYFDNWSVFSHRIPGLNAEALQELQSVAPVPSYLVDIEEYELSECKNVSYVVKNFAIKKVFDFFAARHWSNLFTVEEYKPNADASTDLEKQEREKKEEFRKMYEKLFERKKGCYLVRDETVVDNNKEPNVLKGYTTTPSRLLKEHLYNSDQYMAIDLAVGTIENLDQETMDLLKQFDLAELIDISDNRITEKDKEQITILLTLVSKNNGALVICKNPIVTKQQLPNPYFQDLALSSPADFLRLIWIQKSELEDYAIINRVLGNQVSEKVKQDVLASHKAFYSHLAWFKHGYPFFFTNLYRLRILKD